MTRILTLFALSFAVLLAGCASGGAQVAYYTAVAAQHKAAEAREQRIADQEQRADAAMLKMAIDGDIQAKASTQAYFQTKGLVSAIGKGASAAQPAYQPIEPAQDEVLEYLKVLANPVVNIAGIVANYKQGTRANDNAVIMNRDNVYANRDVTLGSYQTLGATAWKGMEEAGKVTTVRVPSAPMIITGTGLQIVK